MLEIKNLTKSFGTKKAVDNLSLKVDDGTICAFIGKNGAGKTTTLKCVSGILDFETGEILIDGKNIKTQTIDAKMLISYVPDNPDLYEFMTANAYLNFVSDVYKIDKTIRQERILKYAKMFEISDNLSQQISSFSHGMKQKLALICALIHEPKLLILDEPFVGLDPNSTFKLKTLMHELAKSGTSIFFSTHILEVAEKLCDTVAIIDDGKIVVDGKMLDVLGNKTLENIFLSLGEKNE